MAVSFRGRRKIRRSEGKGNFPLLILCISFFVGMLSGTVFSGLARDTSRLTEFLLEYLRAYAVNEDVQVGFFSAVWDLLRWPLLAVALGFSALGVAGIPALMTVRGFLLSFCVASFCRCLGEDGLLAALAVFGIAALLGLPVLFCAALAGLNSARRHAGLQRLDSAMETGEKIASVGACTLVCLVSAVLQTTVASAVLRVIGQIYFNS